MKKPTSFLSAVLKPGRLLARKEYVFIASAQRSGSTLLKALLAEAPDVSHLSEIPFHYYSRRDTWQLKSLAEERILVFKKPSWPGETNYPKLPPVGPHRLILLIRHPYETLLSTGKMYEKLDPEFWGKWSYKKMLYDYWLPTYEGMVNQGLLAASNTTIVRYESMMQQPIQETARLYKWIGSERAEGTETYKKPDKSWAFMQDDGSKNIKSLKVQPRSNQRTNTELSDLIDSEPRVRKVLQAYGYEIQSAQA